MVYVTTPNQPSVPDIASMRFGNQRTSMRTNLLIHKPGLGETSKMTFSNAPADKVFGMPKLADAEGARDVTSLWVSHTADPNEVAGPDFRSMNKLAAIKGITTSREQPPFRKQHPQRLRSGEAVRTPAPPVPSDLDPTFTYGMPGTYRSAEQVRAAGTFDPPMKPLVQHQYAHSWIKMNAARAAEFNKARHSIVPRDTVATQGHAKGAQLARERTERKQHGTAQETFKLSKFKRTGPRVFQHLQKEAGLVPETAPGPETERAAAAELAAEA